MKRAAVVLSSALLTVLCTAATALAQATDYPPTSPGPTTSVAGESGGDPGGVGTAFTGGDVSLPALAFAAFLVLGVAALFVARRRAARFAG